MKAGMEKEICVFWLPSCRLTMECLRQKYGQKQLKGSDKIHSPQRLGH